MTDLEDRPYALQDFVPSVREVEQGLADYRFEPLQAEAVERVPVRTRLAQGLRSLDPRTLGASPRPIVLLGLVGLLGTWDAEGFTVLSPNIKDTFHTNLGFLIALSTILGFVTTLLAPVTGYLADRVNRVRLLAFGSVVSAVAQIFGGRAPSTGVLAATRAGGGVGQAFTSPVALPLVGDFYPVQVRARAITMVFAFFGLGTTLGPGIAGTLGSLFGWRTALVVLGLASVVVSLAVLTLREPVRGVQERRAEGQDERAANTAQQPVGWAEGWRIAASISTLRRIWYVVPFLAATIAITTPLFSLYYSSQFGVGTFARGAIFTVDGVFGLAGLVMASTVADRLIAVKPGRVFGFTAVLFVINALIMAAMAFSPSVWLSIVVALPLQATAFLFLPALFSLISVVVPARIRGFGLQTVAPWQLLGFVLVEVIFLEAPNLGVRATLLLMVPFYLIGALVVTGGIPGVARDMRAARAASVAEDVSRASRASGGNKVLVIRDLEVSYDSSQVLFGVDLDIEEGELIALLGTNGAGKSTLLRAITGIQEASGGAIFFDGRDITHRPPYLNAADGIVFMPGGAAVFPSLSVAENLRAAGWLYRADEDYVASRTAEVLEMFPVLAERMGTAAGNLSGGEQQMVALGQAFLMRPRLLMIDELSLGLAPVVVESLLDIVRRINAEGTTVLLVEQSANVALTVAHRSVFMDKGAVRFDGPTEVLLARGDLLRAVFLGGTGGATATGYVSGSRSTRGTDESDGPALEARDIWVSFGGRAVLRGVGAKVDAGEVLGVIGPNGAGKTTLFDVISGYVRPESGVVRVAGTDLDRLGPDARARLGLCRSFQNARLFPALTVRENIAVALERRLAVRSAAAAVAWLPNVSRAERRIRRRVDYLIDLMHLDAYADKFARELSTGSRRMVDIACVMAVEPKVLLLDEPSSGLAQSEVELLAPVVRRLAKETGCGVLVIEHDIPLVTSLADRLLALRLGSNLREGAPAEVVADPEVVRAYLGTSEATIQRSGAVLPAALAAAGLLTETPLPERTDL